MIMTEYIENERNTMKYENEAVYRRIELDNGEKIIDAIINKNAPVLPGFIAIKTNIYNGGTEKREATKYINLNNITEIVIDNEVLRTNYPSLYLGTNEVRVDIKRGL